MNRKFFMVFAAICGAFCSSTIQAQQKIDPTVEVKKDFEGKMLEIYKGKLDTFIDDSLTSFNIKFDYSIFDKPYRDMYEFNPLPSARIHSPVTEKYPVFFAKIGMGYPLNPNAAIYYQPSLIRKNRKGGEQPVSNNTLLLKGNYDAFWGKIPLVRTNGETFKTEKGINKAAADHSTMGLGADFRHIWRGGEFKIGVDFSSNYYTYYGFEDTYVQPDPLFFENSKNMRKYNSHTFNNFGINFTIGSVDAKGKGGKFNYSFYASYLNTSDKMASNNSDPAIPTGNNLGEHLLKAGGEFGPTFGKYSKFLIGINSETVIYNGAADYHYGTIEAIPQYKFEKGRLLLNVGIKLSGSYNNNSEANKYHNIVSPHVRVSYELAKNNLWIYGIASGGNSINSYSSLLRKNKWIIPADNMMASSIPLLIRGGFKGNVYDKFSYEIYGCYSVHNGLPQFVNSMFGNHFSTIYSNHNELSFGGELNFISKKFTGGAKLKYSSYTNGKKSTFLDGYAPLGYAPFEGTLSGEYNWRERIYIGADIYYRSATPFYLKGYMDENPKIKDFADLGLTVKYVINQHFAVYIQGGNLLNAQIQYHPYYLEKGINFGAGVTVKF